MLQLLNRRDFSFGRELRPHIIHAGLAAQSSRSGFAIAGEHHDAHSRAAQLLQHATRFRSQFIAEQEPSAQLRACDPNFGHIGLVGRRGVVRRFFQRAVDEFAAAEDIKQAILARGDAAAGRAIRRG